MSLLELDNVKMHFPIRTGLFKRVTGHVYAVDGINLKVKSGETLGLVGESGCGKSTLGRTIIRLYQPSGGKISFQDQNIANLNGPDLKQFRRHVQMVFQDPFSSLNPRRTVASIVGQPLHAFSMGSTAEVTARVGRLLTKVGLGEWALNRYPHEFSGGQRQRIAIARAIAQEPQLVIADEPVSALDVSVQSQIINLLEDLQTEMGMAMLFIAHDLAVVKHVCDRIAVMYLGRIVELADKKTLFAMPTHPYTKALMAAIPIPGAKKRSVRPMLTGDVPSPINPPSGCTFHPRCPYAQERCRKDVPVLQSIKDAHGSREVACHFAKDILEGKLNPRPTGEKVQLH